MRPVDQVGVRTAVAALLRALGRDTEDESIRDTPDRVARAWTELLAGYGQRAEEVLATTFGAGEYDQIVALRDIPFFSTCEHHLLPFHGTADVAYVPNGRVVGLSKLARLVDMHARRLQLQERMTRDVASDLERVLGASAVAVVVRAQHLCMCARGVGKSGASMVTSDVRGAFREEASARAEVFALLKA